ncbi:MAG: type II secretion system F family protein, partial [Nocardioidaceae bacterium]
LSLVYSVPGAGAGAPDPATIAVTIDGTPLEATAQPASEAQGTTARTAVLAFDVSNSMAGAKFAAAKRAADLFLGSVPADVRVGIVTFAGSVRVLQEPSLDRTASRRLVEGLDLSRGTALYDGLSRAVAAAGTAGPRSVLVLSDGRDTSTTSMTTVTRAVRRAGVKVDVIALDQSAGDVRLLAPLAEAGDGTVVSAADPSELGRIFAGEAQALASQVVVTAALPRDVATEGTLEVGIDVDGATYTDSAFVKLAAATPATAGTASAATSGSTDLRPAPPGFQMSTSAVLVGLAALGAGLLVLLTALLGGLGRRPESLASRIDPYTNRGAAGARRPAEQAPSMTAQAVTVAQKALSGNQGLEARLGAKLDAAGMSLKPAEWLLMHAGIASAATLLVFMLTGAGLLATLLALVGGLLLPWLYLGRRQSRRLKAFNAQLAGTLQLLAGSLQAGLSIAQGMDTIVREGAEPVAGEFRRALVETRLGVQIEDALETVGERMMSDDFTWTVMAIRIQREVGGNLAELLLSVAATLRERDYLRRQVKSLSAEGRFSAYILLSLPPGILAYEAVTNPTYLHPLIATPIGWVMLAGMGLLMGIGAFMMSRMIKMEI